MSHRRAFTLIEILIVVSIIALLIGLAVPAYGMLTKQQARSDTLRFIGQVTAALDAYLVDYPILGDTATATTNAMHSEGPWIYLHRRQISAVPQRTPCLPEIPLRMLGAGTVTAISQAASHATGQYLLDGFGELIRIEAVHDMSGGTARALRGVRVRSTSGTPSKDQDDVVMQWTTQAPAWRQVKYDAARVSAPGGDLWKQKWPWE